MSSSEKLSKQTRSSSFRKDRLILFLAGCALGVACFLWVYGGAIINPMYDAWIFNTDMDLKQHYIGWCHYRMSDWHFPVGLIDTLSYPTSVSVIYTDSIPLVAFIFKLIRNVLPKRFQYFGMFGLLSFMLMGGISSLLIHALISGCRSAGQDGCTSDTDMNKGDGCLSDTGVNNVQTSANVNTDKDNNTAASGNIKDNDTAFPFINNNLEYIISAACSLVYILSFTVLQRMFYHTALGAQWIIVLALYIWVRRSRDGNTLVENTYDTVGSIRITMIYALMGILCVGIHTYYVPMVGSILLAASIDNIIKSKRELTKIKPVVIPEMINLAAFCIAGILTLFVFGGFYGVSSGYGEGFGSFISNLNTFINPIYGSVILRPMKLYYDWQYEGYGYLGAGILICILILIAGYIYKKTGKETGDGSLSPVSSGIIIAVLLTAIDFGLAVFPILTFSDIKIIGVPLPESLKRAFGIFRSNGRFIWVPLYMITTGAIVYTYRLLSGIMLNMRKGKSLLLKIMLLLVLIQVLDTTKTVHEKQAYFKEEQAYTNLWAMAPFPAGDIIYREFVFLYNDNDIIMDTAFYAYLNGKRLNNYYYARNIDDEINSNIRQWRGELLSGFVRDDVIYICKNSDPLSEFLKADSNGNGLKSYEVDDAHTAFVRR